ncbi:hypothetical protein [Paenibacillus sp. UNC451MF]|uniref:hypothetical protein n=1 Tax=Paenibacillus sp. UNC451MF TaxID=1449063 RepID=UPI00068F6F52|nr:hypothetical protein [Paenibacillus sp. UNC451MF]
MWLLIGIVLTLVWTCLKEYPRLWKERRKKELVLLTLVTIVVSALSLAESIGAHLPNPLDWIAMALGPYPKAVYSLFR